MENRIVIIQPLRGCWDLEFHFRVLHTGLLKFNPFGIIPCLIYCVSQLNLNCLNDILIKL